MGKGRLEAFSDGVFAIAITLLVLTIPQPDDFRQLGDSLLEQWPAYAAYLVSFAVIGIMWINHHTLFGHFERADRNLAYLNLALLATVVFVPYPTGVFGEALQRGEGERVAAVFYSIIMTMTRSRGLRSGCTDPRTVASCARSSLRTSAGERR